ncbi:MAG: DUF305 domain-containing protein [Aestuariivirga sp.]
MNTKTLMIGVAVIVALGALVYTQLPKDVPDSMSGMDHSAMTAADVPASTKAYEAAMAIMMKDMAVPYTGNADVDFMKSMIPHHQGAIDMAKVALQFAKDPEVLKLARDVITAQEAEIAFMKDWLAKNAK